jgi:hypothetical protein
MVVHACNLIYWGGRRITDSNPALAQLERTYVKSKLQIKGLRVLLKW